MDRSHDGGMLVNMAFTWGKCGLLHPPILKCEMLLKVAGDLLEAGAEFCLWRGEHPVHKLHELFMDLIHGVETEQELVTPRDCALRRKCFG